MASPAPVSPSTGVVALGYALKTLSVIIADHATDIPYSTDALSRLTKLLPRSIRTFDNVNQASQVADYFLLQAPKWKSAYHDEAFAQPPSLVAQDPYLMALVELRKNGECVRDALLEKKSESWPSELRGMLSLTGFSF